MSYKSLILFAALFSFGFISLDNPQGLNVGEQAPDFNSVDQNSKPIQLKKLIESGPVVLIFYRGEWCPYCNKQLKALEDSMSYIVAKGAALIAITPETKNNIEKTVQKTNATYSIIHDEGSRIMNAYKVAFELDKKTQIKYKGYGVDLIERNGSNGNNLPVPAVYIINKEGKITYRYFDENFRNRASISEILSHL